MGRDQDEGKVKRKGMGKKKRDSVIEKVKGEIEVVFRAGRDGIIMEKIQLEIEEVLKIREGLEREEDIHIVVVDQRDFVLVEKEKAVKRIKEGKVKFVDVTKDNPNAPEIVEKGQIMEIVSNELEKERERNIHRIGGESINVTSLFGILLGYPVIYWYSNNEAKTHTGNGHQNS